jgi:nicotinate-nucleotide pyrophosphorylase (carboxylating)
VKASRGVTLDSTLFVAESGVDFISFGAFTHSAMALDMSMEVGSA